MDPMQVVQFAIGKPSAVVRLEPVTVRAPDPKEVGVRIEWCPVDPADLLRLTGTHAFPTPLPSTPGIEAAGVVEAVGADVKGVKVGDLVAILWGGTWTQRFVGPEDAVVPLPADMDRRQASMMGVNPLTAVGLLEIPRLSPGDWIVQNAANSAVAKMIVRLAKKRGLRTLNVVRREEVRAELEALGADVVLVGNERLKERVAEATGNAPLLFGLDAIGGKDSGRMLECLAPGGTLVVYGLLSGLPVELPLAPMVFFDYTVRGFTRLHTLQRTPRPRVLELFRELASLVSSGELATEIEATYPLRETGAALDHASRGGRSGKVLLHISK